jgi:hypothetical protein
VLPYPVDYALSGHLSVSMNNAWQVEFFGELSRIKMAELSKPVLLPLPP